MRNSSKKNKAKMIILPRAEIALAVAVRWRLSSLAETDASVCASAASYGLAEDISLDLPSNLHYKARCLGIGKRKTTP